VAVGVLVGVGVGGGVGVTVGVGVKVGARVQGGDGVGGRSGDETVTRAVIAMTTRLTARMMPVASVGVDDERDGI
jgi:hypothetical protein